MQQHRLGTQNKQKATQFNKLNIQFIGYISHMELVTTDPKAKILISHTLFKTLSPVSFYRVLTPKPDCSAPLEIIISWKEGMSPPSLSMVGCLPVISGEDQLIMLVALEGNRHWTADFHKHSLPYLSSPLLFLFIHPSLSLVHRSSPYFHHASGITLKTFWIRNTLLFNFLQLVA